MNHEWCLATGYCKRCGCDSKGAHLTECRDDLIAISHRRALAIVEERERRAQGMVFASPHQSLPLTDN